MGFWKAAFLICFLLSTMAVAQNRVVEYWHVGSYEEVEAVKQMAEAFKLESGITVNVQPIPWGSYQTKYFTAMASGDTPDAGTTNLSGGTNYGKVGGVIDLERRYPEQIARIKEHVFPEMWPTCYFKGHLFAIPYDVAVLIGFYRKDIFNQFDLEVPETWSQLTALLNKLNANGYPYGFLWTRNAHWGLANFTWGLGSDGYVENGRKVNWNDPRFIRGYTYAMDLWNSYNLVSEKAVEQFAIKDTRQALPLFFNYHSTYSEILIRAPHLKDDFGIFAFPYADEGHPASMMGGRVAVVFRDAKNPDDAMRWLEFALSKKAQTIKYRFLADLGERSALDLSVNQRFWEQDLGLKDDDQQIFHEIFQRLQTRSGVPWSNESDRLLEQSIYRTEEVARNYLSDLAQKTGISLRELKTAMAAGELTAEKQNYQRFLSAHVNEMFTELTPQAQSRLDAEFADYQKYFGHLTEVAVEATYGWDVLDYSELIVFFLCLAFFALVLTRSDMRVSLHSYLYIAPAVISALVFIIIPVFVSLYLSFTKYNPLTPLSTAHWVGLENYSQLLSDPVLWRSLLYSVYFAILVIPMQLVIGVVLAACLDKNLWPERFWKFLYFSPLVTSVVSVSLIWFALYAGTEYGWINSLLLNAGIIRDPIIFLKDKDFFLNCIIVMTIWQGLAFTILILLAGFQSIPDSQYEAASIDGAGPIRQFWSISLPNLRPQFTFLVVMGTIGAIQVFEQIYMMGGGAGEAESKFGPDDSGMTIVPFIYRKGFEYFKMGEASAIAYVLFIFLFVLTFFNLRLILTKD